MWRRAAWLTVLVGEILVEEEDLHVLGAVGEDLDFEFRVASRGAVERAAGEVGAEGLEHAHDLHRCGAHLEQALGLLVVLIQRLPGTQLGFDLGVVRQRVGVGGAELLGGLALGEAEVADAILGHHARRQCGDLAPKAAAAGNVSV